LIMDDANSLSKIGWGTVPEVPDHMTSYEFGVKHKNKFSTQKFDIKHSLRILAGAAKMTGTNPKPGNVLENGAVNNFFHGLNMGLLQNPEQALRVQREFLNHVADVADVTETFVIECSLNKAIVDQTPWLQAILAKHNERFLIQGGVSNDLGAPLSFIEHL